LLGMANTLNAVKSLGYFRLIRKAWLVDFRLYQIKKDAIAWLLFFVLFFFCSYATGVCMSHVEGVIVGRSYCLAVGIVYEDKMLSALWLALCSCIPSFVTLCYFLLGATYLASLKNRNAERGLEPETPRSTGTTLGHLISIQAALKYSVIS